MSDSPAASRPSPVSKKRFRFSLRTLLVAFTVVSLWCGYFIGRVKNERRAAEAVSAAWGEIAYDWQIRPPNSDPKVKRTKPGPAWLRRRLGPHWFDQIVEVRINEFNNGGNRNRFALVGPPLAKLPALRSLALSREDLDLATCELLGRLTQVERLSLTARSVLEPQHTAAIARARGLEQLRLGYAKISPAAIRELAKLPKLQEINISCDSFDPKTGRKLSEYLLDDESASAIASLPRLRSVMLFETRITDVGVAALCELPRLETLVVSSPRVTSAVFEHVARARRLEYLGTWGWTIEDADLEQLRQLPNLTSLDLRTNLTDESVRHLLPLERLKQLTLIGDGITDASVPLSCRLRNLTWLDLSDTSIQKNGDAARMLKQALPACRIRLPKTEREREAERIFTRQRFEVDRRSSQD